MVKWANRNDLVRSPDSSRKRVVFWSVLMSLLEVWMFRTLIVWLIMMCKFISAKYINHELLLIIAVYGLFIFSSELVDVCSLQ